MQLRRENFAELTMERDVVKRSVAENHWRAPLHWRRSLVGQCQEGRRYRRVETAWRRYAKLLGGGTLHRLSWPSWLEDTREQLAGDARGGHGVRARLSGGAVGKAVGGSAGEPGYRR